MPQVNPQFRPLTDEELLAVADDPMLQAKFTSEERRRLSRLKPRARTWTETAVDALPMLGGAIGGFAGGPVGAGLLGAAGTGYRQLVTHATELPGSVADVGRNLLEYPRETLGGFLGGADAGALAAAQSGVANAALEVGGDLAMRGAKAGAKAVYRGYLKPSLAARHAPKAAQIVETALEEALPVTKAGAARATTVIQELRGQVDDLLKQSPDTVDLHQIAEKVRAFAKRKYYRPGATGGDFEAAMKVAESIDRHASLGLPVGARPTRLDVPLSSANAVKRTLDEAAGEAAFGSPNASAMKQAQKTGRRALRLDIEAKTGGAAGQVATLNARESRLIDAAKAIAAAVGREGNRNQLAGTRSILAGGVGSAEYYRTRDPVSSAAKALALRIGLDPAVATRAAIVAYHLGKQSGAYPATIARVAVQAVSEAQDDAGDLPGIVEEQAH